MYLTLPSNIYFQDINMASDRYRYREDGQTQQVRHRMTPKATAAKLCQTSKVPTALKSDEIMKIYTKLHIIFLI